MDADTHTILLSSLECELFQDRISVAFTNKMVPKVTLNKLMDTNRHLKCSVLQMQTLPHQVQS